MRFLLFVLLACSSALAQPVMPFSPSSGGGGGGAESDPLACKVAGLADCQMLAQIRGNVGTASLPSFASPLANAANDGLYFPSTATIGFTTDGSLRLTLGNTLTSTVPWVGIAGSAAIPSLSFAADPNTGFFNTADAILATTGGIQRLALSTTSLTSTLPVLAPSGTAAAPALSFSGDPNTGIFSAAADDMGFAANGSSELLLNTAALRPATSVGLSLGTVTSGWNQVFSTGGSAAAAFANINDTDTGLYFNGATTVGLTLNNAAFVNLLADRASITTSQGSVDFNNSGSLTMSAVTPTVGLSGGMLAGWHSWGTTANTMRGTAPTAIPSCAASSSGLIVYKEDTDTAGTNSQLCLCARNNAALTYSWIAIGGALTGTCT